MKLENTVDITSLFD